MSLFDDAQRALGSIDAKKIASTDQQLRHAQVLALLSVTEELAALRRHRAEADPRTP